MNKRKVLGLLAVAACAWVIFAVTGASPANFILIRDFAKSAEVCLMPLADLVPLLRQGGMTALVNIGGNIALFAPLGFVLAGCWPYFRRLRRTAAFGCALSVCIEVCQLFNYRATVTDDVLLNTLGALLGGACAVGVLRLLRCRPAHETVRGSRAWLPPAAVCLLVLAVQTVREAWVYLTLR